MAGVSNAFESAPSSGKVGSGGNLLDPSLAAAGVEDGVEFGAGFGSSAPTSRAGPSQFRGFRFRSSFTGKGHVGRFGGAGPYPAQGGSFVELLQVIRVGNQNVDAKFGRISA